MGNNKVYRAIGLMSGTSLDGVDAALLETDGQDFVRPVGSCYLAYSPWDREKIRSCLGQSSAPPDVTGLITERHIEAVKVLLDDNKVSAKDIHVIGFHGQTIYHNPEQKVTVQIGDAQRIMRAFGVNVVADFRSADVKAGGQGAPLLPLYHAARVKGDNLELPVAVLNIGGVANVTWIGEDEILAFDTGPGNALIDDWVKKNTGADYDEAGALAMKGTIDKKILAELMAHPYFSAKPPKSLDRDQWNLKPVEKLSCEDGAATLAAFTVESIKRALEFFPVKPRQWLVSGGGRNNDFLMDYLRITLAAPVNKVEQQDWDGNATEAEGFAYLAVRSLLGLPLSLPTTTGVPQPLTGGVLYKA